jgi:hypothetical protein
MIMSYLQMRADPLHSLDCSTFRPGMRLQRCDSAAIMTAARRSAAAVVATQKLQK